MSSSHTSFHELPPHATALKVGIHCQTLKLGKFRSIDFDRREANQLLGLTFDFLEGNKAVSSQFDDFGFGSGQQQALHYIGSHQRVDGFGINRLCLPQLYVNALFDR